MRDRGGPDPYMVGKPKGLIAPGNIDLLHRPVAHVPGGGIATVLSTSFNIGGAEVLVPMVINGRVVNANQAREHYVRTGQHLGKFRNWRQADRYANQLHLQQQQLYG